MRISQLEAIAANGGRIALWGWGREGRAAYAALRAARDSGFGIRDSVGVPLTVFCAEDETADVLGLGDPSLDIETVASSEHLARFDVVIKSPGISPYRPEAMVSATQGTRFIGGTALWFAERAAAGEVAAGTVCVTGTKGKSTTTALLAHLLRAHGLRTALAGNIGLPLLELLDAQADAWAIELSSYQTGDVAASGVRPEIALVTNIFPEHLDWHGSEAQYVDDKLSLLTRARPRIAVLNAGDPRLAALALPGSEIRWFNTREGWHLRGDILHRGDTAVMDTSGLPLPGRHNRGNLCGVLTAIEALGIDAAPLAAAAGGFVPLPHRLQPLGTRDGVLWVNDSISTTPHASLAALDVYRDRRVALLVGGHDRGLDWQAFADAMRTGAPHAIVTMGQNGPRIFDLLVPVALEAGFQLLAADDLESAIAQARTALNGEGVLLLSPGAPSFGAYRDYTARGRHFAVLGGFDPDAITAIPGIGIA
ncbi:UDP-N-acetylmuramoyl-L-alanine--D-glutamate ligase [Luteimonas sp. 3794]|uniref:UDP-N-acetylmuramoyl-L-alanine--D-glutamate ligase n=1 Tax=Luteimonas sp. 3794 TaxID=2817730 RepID=UPI002862EDE7|nr:UDP-N-acetylmuramoyl-L-alanine--D-glutamate ligase [Luteimonas sp. 3794]MDR6993021.1 UDP-N-acetylmuramoylalanine--D-glutamate ligase [Luteimonas sp. 3794]